MEVTQSAVSHQLRVLKNSKLVKFRREGKTVYYSLADDHVIHSIFSYVCIIILQYAPPVKRVQKFSHTLAR